MLLMMFYLIWFFFFVVFTFLIWLAQLISTETGYYKNLEIQVKYYTSSVI